jgi:hypothetical protein
VIDIPADYLKMRDEINSRCKSGKAPGKKPDESCMQYAKRLASIIYYKRHGKTPEQGDAEISLMEDVEKLLGLAEE